jgi:hypothetical protein
MTRHRADYREPNASTQPKDQDQRASTIVA